MVKRVVGPAEGIHESLKQARWIVAGREYNRAGWGGVGCTRARGRRPNEGGRGVPSQVEVRGREDRNEITTFRRCQLYQTVIQGASAIPGG